MPTWRNIFVNPQVRVSPGSDNASTGAVRKDVLYVSGLVCHSLCVRRAMEGLKGVPGVGSVSFYSGPDRFEVEYQNGAVDTDALDKAILGKIIAAPLRRLLDMLGRRLFRLGISGERVRTAGDE